MVGVELLINKPLEKLDLPIKVDELPDIKEISCEIKNGDKPIIEPPDISSIERTSRNVLMEQCSLRAFETSFVENAKNEVKSLRHITTINEDLAGQKYPNTDVEYVKHIFVLDGEKVEGVFPKFDSKFDTMLPKELRTASDTEQFKYCTQQLAEYIEKNPELAKQFTSRQFDQIKNGEPRISGLTWHHNEYPGKLQLVNFNEHNTCRHTGGRSIWGGGVDCR